jgi:hypothetical protein
MKSPHFLILDRAGALTGGAPRSGDTGSALPLPGLVSLKTSDTLTPQTVEIDSEKARHTRLKRSILVAAKLFEHSFRGGFRMRPAMLTLTYRDVDGFAPRHVSELLKRIRQWLLRRGKSFHYVWVAELQLRGALHYHVVIWLPKGLTLPKPDKQGWWPHGSTRIEWARHPVGYLIKYASKFDVKGGLPKGARLHGSGGFDEFSKQIRRWFNLPTWLKCLAGVGSRFMRIKGVGLVASDTGVCVQSPWRVSCRGGRVFATKVFEYIGGLKDVVGPYTLIGSPHLL